MSCSRIVFVAIVLFLAVRPVVSQEKLSPVLQLQADWTKLQSNAAQYPQFRTAFSIVGNYEIQAARLTVFPDNEFGLLPVLQIDGNVEKLKSLLSDENSPVASAIKSLGDSRYQIRMDDRRGPGIDLFVAKLHERQDGIVLAHEAARQEHLAIAANPIANSDDSDVAVEVDLNRDLGFNPVDVAFKKAGLENHPIGMIVGFMQGVFFLGFHEEAENVDHITLRLQSTDDQRQLMAKLKMNNPDAAQAAVDLLSGKAKPKYEQKDFFEAITDKRLAHDVSYDASTSLLSNKFQWSRKDEVELAKQMHHAQGRMIKLAMQQGSKHEVAPKYETHALLSLPLPALEKRKASFANARKNGWYWKPGQIQNSSYGPGREMVGTIDFADPMPMEFATFTLKLNGVFDKDGKNYLRRRDGQQPDDPVGCSFSLAGKEDWRNKRNELRIPLTKDATSSVGLSRLEGVLEAKLPKTIHKIMFSTDDPKGTERTANGVTLRLERIDNDLAVVSSVDENTNLYGMYVEVVDSSKRLLKVPSRMGGGGFLSLRCDGKIRGIRFSIPEYGEPESFPVDWDFDAQDTPATKEAAKVSATPSGNKDAPRVKRYDRARLLLNAPSKIVPPTIKVSRQWSERQKQDQLMIAVESNPKPIKAEWEVFPFAENGLPLGLQAGQQSDEAMQLNADSEIRFVKGTYFATIPKLENVRINAKQGEKIEKELSDGSKISIAFDGHKVDLELGAVGIKGIAAYDSDGNRLLSQTTDRWSSRIGNTRSYWGNVAAIEMLLYPSKSEVEIPFEQRFGEFDQKAVDSFFAKLPKYRQLAKVFAEMPSDQPGAAKDPTGLGYKFQMLKYGNEKRPESKVIRLGNPIKRPEREEMFAVPPDQSSDPIFRKSGGKVRWALLGDDRWLLSKFGWLPLRIK